MASRKPARPAHKLVVASRSYSQAVRPAVVAATTGQKTKRRNSTHMRLCNNACSAGWCSTQAVPWMNTVCKPRASREAP